MLCSVTKSQYSDKVSQNGVLAPASQKKKKRIDNAVIAWLWVNQ